MIPGESSPANIFKEPYPCDGCQHWNFCKKEMTSCKSFYIYVTERGRLDLEHRTPNTDVYHRTFIKRRKADLVWEKITLVAN